MLSTSLSCMSLELSYCTHLNLSKVGLVRDVDEEARVTVAVRVLQIHPSNLLALTEQHLSI